MIIVLIMEPSRPARDAGEVPEPPGAGGLPPWRLCREGGQERALNHNLNLSLFLSLYLYIYIYIYIYVCIYIYIYIYIYISGETPAHRGIRAEGVGRVAFMLRIVECELIDFGSVAGEWRNVIRRSVVLAIFYPPLK